MPPTLRTIRTPTGVDRKAFSDRLESGQEPIKTGKRASILVVDDDPAVARTIRRILGRKNDTAIAGNGSEGLAMFQANRPDLVISDMDMPGMNGLEMLKAIKKLAPDAKVIMMSGDLSGERREEMTAAGALHIIPKPFEFDDVTAAVEKALSG